MVIRLAHLQTIFLLLLPLLFSRFNVLLASGSPSCEKVVRFGEARRAFPEVYKIQAAAFEPRKVIKETLIGEAGYRIKTIVIDPGHGGHDPGCLGSNVHEKNLALAIALNLADGIHREYPDIRIIMTRDSDVFVPLHERAAIANRNQADLFISIHCNFIPGRPTVKGSETYVLGLHRAEQNLEVAKRENSAILLETDYEKNYNLDDPQSHIMFSMFQSAYLEQSILLAEKIEKAFAAQTGRPSRSVRQAGFQVLRQTAMPSVLIETGYLSNIEEENYLSSPDGQLTIANAILSAIAEYKLAVESPDFHTPAETKTQTVTNASYASSWEQPKGGTPAVTRTPPPPKEPEKVVPRPIVNEAPRKQAAPVQVEPEPRMYSSSQPVAYENRNNIYAEKVVYENDAAAGAPSNGIQFCVQLAAARQAFDTSQSKWRNTGYLLEVVEENATYKCIACGFSSHAQAYEARMKLQQKGFPDAFIVAYKYGQRMPLEQAMREAGVK